MKRCRNSRIRSGSVSVEVGVKRRRFAWSMANSVVDGLTLGK